MLEEAKQVCPTTTRRLVSEGTALLWRGDSGG